MIQIKTMKKQFLLLFVITIASIACSRRSSSNGVNVFQSFSLNGKSYGVSENIDLANTISWAAGPSSNPGSTLTTLNMNYKSPDNGGTYCCLLFYINNITLGSNVATLAASPGCESWNSSSSFRINFTHVASAVGDYYEGSFSGNISVFNTCNMTSNAYPSSGNFKVYRTE